MDMPADKTMLKQAISDYLLWMVSNGYSPKTVESYESILKHFLIFISCTNIAWRDIFTLETLNDFQKGRSKSTAHAVRGLSRYLFQQKRISQSIPVKDYRLPEIYEAYLAFRGQNSQIAGRQIKWIRRVLAAFNEYIEKYKLHLSSLKIEQVDAFLAESFMHFAPATCRVYRSMLRGFLTYLYQERNIIKRDLAPLLVGRREYAKAKPPNFLRPGEVQKLLASLKTSTSSDIRTYAMVHLVYTMGLRPKEVCQVSLDDISFSRKLLTLRDRKGNNPFELPIPEYTIKTIAAYIIAARPQSKHRTLFLTLHPPHRPMSANTLGYHIKKAMKKVGLSSTAYWLRHTYAQNLLEAGASIFDIKEMLGHDKIESTKLYLNVHTKLMRQVLFDETF
jgi:integrase/recombinase XerD